MVSQTFHRRETVEILVTFSHSSFQNDNMHLPTGKRYRPDYMEDAIAKYLTLCQAPEFAVR